MNTDKRLPKNIREQLKDYKEGEVYIQLDEQTGAALTLTPLDSITGYYHAPQACWNISLTMSPIDGLREYEIDATTYVVDNDKSMKKQAKEVLSYWLEDSLPLVQSTYSTALTLLRERYGQAEPQA